MIFSFVPQPPNFPLDWQGLTEAFEWVAEMRGCEQSPLYHAEGDVWIHTRRVCEAVIDNPEWRALDETARAVIFIASLLHDVAKPACTRTQDDGRITSHGHSLMGEKVARELLWAMDVPFHWREQIAALVRYHQAPFFLIERDDVQRNVYRVSQTARCDYLAQVARADALGRICPDQQRLLDNIGLFVEYAREHDCLDKPRKFASDHSRFLYFRKASRDPDYAAYDDTRCEVVLLSGLPGSGKDHIRRQRFGGWNAVSLDDIRRELKIEPTDNQGAVIAEAKERARQFLRRRENFVWNATNLSRELRSHAIDLLADYNARVRIVYVEAPLNKLYMQNRERQHTVPETVMKRMMEKWEVPDLTEAHRVEWIVTNHETM